MAVTDSSNVYLAKLANVMSNLKAKTDLLVNMFN